MTKPLLAKAHKRLNIRARLSVWARSWIVVALVSFSGVSRSQEIDDNTWSADLLAYIEEMYYLLGSLTLWTTDRNNDFVNNVEPAIITIQETLTQYTQSMQTLPEELVTIRDLITQIRDFQERIADYQLETIKDLASSMDTNLVAVYSQLSDFRFDFNDWTLRLKNEYDRTITQLVQSIYHIEDLNDSSDLTLSQIYALLSGGNITAHVSLDSLGTGIDLDSLHFTMKNPFVFDYSYIEYLYDLVSNGSTIYSPSPFTHEGRATFFEWRNRPSVDFSFTAPFSPDVNTLYLDNISGDNFYNDTITFYNNYQSLLNNINDSLIFLCQNLITNADFSANDSELETAQENAESFISSLDFSDLSNFDRTEKMGDVVSVLGNFSVPESPSDHSIQFRSLSLWDFSPSEVITIDYGSDEFSSWLDFVRKMSIGFWWILNISFIASASFGVYKLAAWLYQTFVNLQSA